MKYRGRSDFYIAQVLGISMADVEKIVDIGKQKRLIDQSGNLTHQAKTIYSEIRKKDRILDNAIAKNLSKQNINTVYVPTSFQGFS